METSQIITLISGAGIGAVLSAFLTFINSSKKNKLDFITKERSEWRIEIKSIIVDLLGGNNRKNALSRLETQLNPYGRYISKEDRYNFYMNDGHIWELIDNFDYSNRSVKILTKYLEILLKYDWERSKREIKVDVFNSFIYFILIIGAISNSLLILFKINDLPQIIILSLSSYFMVGIIFYISKITKKFKQKRIRNLICIILLCLSMHYSIDGLLYWIIPHETIDLKNYLVTFMILVLMMSVEFKIFLNTNDEEEKYIAHISCIKNISKKENTHV
ncbi:hypothetical protein B7708_05245 [Streptococcus oralis subsp. dentisani]|uniref:Uncharacterized protein n=1 Tax=Streptococcus oralis subsp. dentisani TaxID=1458253 RepID=A0A1X1IVQ7_STROR|nr:hypothetical protein B7708_05245 [Streptococcus oralis subsp. dentisani]